METAVPAAVMPDYFERLERHILQELAEGVAAWGQSVTALGQWEEEHLLENPCAEALATHRSIVEKMIAFGRVLALPTDHAEFPQVEMKKNVAAILQTLRDKIPVSSSRMPRCQADIIIKSA